MPWEGFLEEVASKWWLKRGPAAHPKAQSYVWDEKPLRVSGPGTEWGRGGRGWTWWWVLRNWDQWGAMSSSRDLLCVSDKELFARLCIYCFESPPLPGHGLPTASDHNDLSCPFLLRIPAVNSVPELLAALNPLILDLLPFY